MEDVWSDHRPPWRRCRCSHFELRRFVSRNGLSAIDLARIPARHRGRGYLDFARLYKMHQAGAFFVTRAKRGMDARRVYSTPTDRDTGVICDQRIALNGFYISKDYPEYLLRV